ncbi:uncharacterized protein DUF1345 [Brevibacterium sanguinis]|uniref:Uncharacterized protein DUF1345 n=2 Tax=Brevibacterium TaxID=1696 RepID=A0A366IG96_9MICO|nr:MULTISPECIES: DUF1345 domain-containing protein [Brevibacterium]RBP62001.1 uncharacterized protein DUF1345 [Brevibacterium sanguinis]RBP70577.1 uncharacterized protein DUF1345 [Brevibacterium celere]
MQHSRIITSSDDLRANLSVIPALVISGVLVFGLGFEPLAASGDTGGPGDVGGSLIGMFLLAWPLYGGIYLLWTHLGLRELDETELIVHSRWVVARRRAWWIRMFGNGGAVSWAMVAAFVAVLLNIVVASSGPVENSPLAACLGLLDVVVSWAVMVYSFALEFMRLDLGGGGSAHARHLDFDMREPRSFGDYLTFSVLSSTMTAALPGKAITAAGWRLVRSNVIVAFAFNSVVVATLVSMILSYLMG